MFRAALCVALQDFLDFLPIYKSGRPCQSWYIVSCQIQHSLWLAAALPDSLERLDAILKIQIAHFHLIWCRELSKTQPWGWLMCSEGLQIQVWCSPNTPLSARKGQEDLSVFPSYVQMPFQLSESLPHSFLVLVFLC